MLEALLRACSVALLIEAPLLRDLRLLLPEADARLEEDLRRHPEVCAVAGVCAMKFEHVERRLEELAAENDEFLERLKGALPDLLRRHHHVHGALLRASETYNLRAAGFEVTEQESAAAQAVFRAGNRTRLDEIDSATGEQGPTDRRGLAAWYSRELARKSRARTVQDFELASACALEALAADGSAEPPDGVDPGTYRRTRVWALRKEKRPHVWHDNYTGAPADGAAWFGEGRNRVFRGGGWADHARSCRCAHRYYWVPGDRNDILGFRLVLAAKVREDIGPFS